MTKTLKYIGLSLASFIGFSAAHAVPVSDNHNVTINILEIDQIEVGADVVINYSDLTVPGIAVGEPWTLDDEAIEDSTLAYTTNAAPADARRITVGLDVGMPANTRLRVYAEDLLNFVFSDTAEFPEAVNATQTILENLSGEAAVLDLFYAFGATLEAPPQTIVRNVTFTMVSP